MDSSSLTHTPQPFYYVHSHLLDGLHGLPLSELSLDAGDPGGGLGDKSKHNIKLAFKQR